MTSICLWSNFDWALFNVLSSDPIKFGGDNASRDTILMLYSKGFSGT